MLAGLDDRGTAECLVLQGMALFDSGDVVGAIDVLGKAIDVAASVSSEAQYNAAFALFVRATDFQTPEEAVSGLTKLRELAARVGDARSLCGLHLAVARLEGIRGRFFSARHHLQLARALAERHTNEALRCSVDLVSASVETIAGNLRQCRSLALQCLGRARTAALARYILAATSNLGVASLYLGQVSGARRHLERVLQFTDEITYIKTGSLDSLAQLELYEGNLDRCAQLIDDCSRVSKPHRVPSRSWYDLAHQITRCAYHERLGDWDRIVEICDDADTEVSRRQYKAVRTALLCAKARALTRLGRRAQADRVLAQAVKACPRGAVDSLIVLEGSRAICAAIHGDRSAAALHFDRSLAACRANGHKYHEAWIERQRDELSRTTLAVAAAHPTLDVTRTALVLTDVAAILGAGHSIDLLTHRIVSILEATPVGARLDIQRVSNCAFRPEPSTSSDLDGDGTFSIRLRGSDRKITIRATDVRSIDEISLLKSVADLVQAAVNRTAEAENEDDDQNLWPRTVTPGGEDAVFRSPRMIEIVKIATRLASTELPILLTGETGTGKEVIARLIHDNSRVKRGPFVPFNSSTVPHELVESQLFGHRRGAFTGASDSFLGLIRTAERGTLFLDEIGDLGVASQPKLLRFLESGEIQPLGDTQTYRVRVRLVSATNADVDAMVEQGRFRRDLVYRIGGARLHLPPLRERKDEIPAFASLFLTRHAIECERTGLRLGDDFIAALLLYDWPGNIRELSNEIRRVVAMATNGSTLSSADLLPEIARRWHARSSSDTAPAREAPVVQIRLGQTLGDAISQLEQEFIERAMIASGGRFTEAAKLLGVSRKGLFLKRRRQQAAAARES
jgi:DNA-binding NtrC family response regulator/tetratricopeptide (TPR) repeat protein